LCFVLTLSGAITVMSSTPSAQLRFVYWAGTLLMYLLLTLTIYVVVGQIFPPDDDAYPPERRITPAKVGAAMLVVGVSVAAISYLNLWAADDYFAYRACAAAGRSCEVTAAVWVVLGLRYAGLGLAVLSVPVLLVGLMLDGLEGWG
jgi:hypothetical protein